jgi:hypothetical protein
MQFVRQTILGARPSQMQNLFSNIGDCQGQLPTVFRASCPFHKPLFYKALNQSGCTGKAGAEVFGNGRQAGRRRTMHQSQGTELRQGQFLAKRTHFAANEPDHRRNRVENLPRATLNRSAINCRLQSLHRLTICKGKVFGKVEIGTK